MDAAIFYVLFFGQAIWFWVAGIYHFWAKHELFYAVVSTFIPPVGWLTGVYSYL